jgi:Protein of unknown function (DUF2934)
MVRDTFSPAFVIASAKEIAQRAYEIYVDRGHADSFDRQDWLRAEHETQKPAARRASVSARCDETMTMKHVQQTVPTAVVDARHSSEERSSGIA